MGVTSSTKARREDDLLEMNKLIVAKEVNRMIQRVACQGLHQQQVEFHQAYAAGLEAKSVHVDNIANYRLKK